MSQSVNKSLVMVLTLVAVALGQEDRGTVLFNKTCSRCHGSDGRAKTTAAAKMPMSSLRSKEVQSMSDEQLFNTVAYGTKHKEYPHAFLYHGLTENDVHSIVAHIRTFKEKP